MLVSAIEHYSSLECQEISRDVAHLFLGKMHVGHCIAGHDALRVAKPRHHVVGRVAQKARDINSSPHAVERRAHNSICAPNTGNPVTGPAAEFPYSARAGV